MRSLTIGVLLHGAFLFTSCSGGERKALKQLVQDITSPIPETQAAGQALQVIAILEQSARRRTSIAPCSRW